MGLWLAPALATAMLSTSAASEGTNESRRVAAIDPDAELARALNIALSPWGTTVTKVQLDVTAPIVAERARSIAEQTHADVVMWVAERHGHYAVWIYDVASDHTSLRDLTSSPPFDATTAASVALSIKALLRLTVVAPPRERVGAGARAEPDWSLGVSASLADHEGSTSLLEGRGALYASYWPPLFGHHVGAEIGVSGGTTVGRHQDQTARQPGFDVSLADYGGRAAIGARTPLTNWLGVELSLGATVHLVNVKSTVAERGRTQTLSLTRVDGGFEPQVAFTVAILHDVLRVAPWAGVTVLTAWQRFFVDGTIQLEVSPLTIEGGIRAELTL